MPSQSSISWPAIHWVGVGLASGPGIIALARKWGEISVWDMSLDRAKALKDHIAKDNKLNIRPLNLTDKASLADFHNTLNPGDIIVSMLPAAFHVQMAKMALRANCHMATSSYLSDDMLALNDEATTKGLSLVNEVGLDPGIDHLLTHILVDEARKAGVLGKGRTIDFVSYCGGVPARPTPFTYKFSWTPLGVLTALTNPARMIRNGAACTIEKAWQGINDLPLNGEVFEVYANRDSLPYIAEYGLDGESKLRTFIRGTLRLSGWKSAWQDIFKTLETASPAKLKSLSDHLWQNHQYDDGEEDRVVLYVALTSTDDNGDIWQGSLSLDCSGKGWQSAMASTVSLTVAEAVNALMEARLSPGVQAAPHDVAEARKWLGGLKENGIDIHLDILKP